MKKMLKHLLAGVACLWAATPAGAQELYTFTEPASNMPAHSAGLRLNNWLMQEPGVGLNYHLIPEVMVGLNKNLMIHAEVFLSNRNGAASLHYEGVGLYAKYRFLSIDHDHRHFRMAAFGRLGTNNAPIHQEEIETNGHNSGYEAGIVGTQLLRRTALSGSLAYEHATDNAFGREAIPIDGTRHAVNTTLSFGHLILPRKYTGYEQTNLNGMVELLSQWLPATGRYYIDVAPSVQLIFHSQTRLDIGYRMPLLSQMERTAPQGFLLRLEHNLFSVF